MVGLTATALTHADSHPEKKKAAAQHGVSLRTEYRYRTPSGAAGCALHIYSSYLENAQRPWRLLAHNRSKVIERTLLHLSDTEVVERISELHRESAIQEGKDKANRATRGMDHVDRAVDAERVATHHLELAALWRIAASRGITEADVFGHRS